LERKKTEPITTKARIHQKKCTATRNKYKKIKARFSCLLYDIRPENGAGLFSKKKISKREDKKKVKKKDKSRSIRYKQASNIHVCSIEIKNRFKGTLRPRAALGPRSRKIIIMVRGYAYAEIEYAKYMYVRIFQEIENAYDT